MDIVYKENGPDRYELEVWVVNNPPPLGSIVYNEDVYNKIDRWCVDHLKYAARTSYNTFEFKTGADTTLFVLQWVNMH
jgi:hypothetical protein